MLAAFTNASSRFNAMTLRERAMVSAALLALLVLAWDQLLMSPLRAQKLKLGQEIEEIHRHLATLTETIEGNAQSNPLAQAMQQKQALTESLAAVDEQLQSTSAGLIPPPKMLAALRDVLDKQSGLKLISMRNLPVTSLVATNEQTDAQAVDKRAQFDRTGASRGSGEQPAAMRGPYVHSMEIVIEGTYLDVLRYLQSVEALPWRFYWQVLELKTTEYPRNLVLVRINTLSMDQEWLGV